MPPKEKQFSKPQTQRHHRKHNKKPGAEAELHHPVLEFHNILFPVDGTEFGAQALRYAVALAAKLNAHMRLFSASTETDPDEMWRYLGAAEGVVQAAGVADVDSAFLPIDTTKALVEQSKYHDLVVMSTHGRHGLDRLVFGSVTECVLRSGEAPVLCLRNQERDFAIEMDHMRVLICYDGSEYADHALAAVFSIIQRFKFDVTLLHVIKDDSGPAAGGAKALATAGLLWESGASKPTMDQKYENGFQVLAHAATVVERYTKVRPHTKVRAATPDEGVAAVILEESHAFSIVALATHGRDGPRASLEGSVTETVVRGATVPILAVGPNCR